MIDRFPLGYNTYSIRALRWNDLQLIEYAASLKLDAIFLQDSIDPGINDPAHWKDVKDAAKRQGLWLGTGGSAVLPRSDESAEFDRSVKLLRDGLRRAVGMGSPLVRILLASDRDHLPPGSPEKHIATMIKVLRTVRAEAVDAGVKFAIENHKDLLCWQTRQVIDGAGKEFVGSYLDTGNPVFVMEDPMQTVETLGPVAVMLHLRDSVVYEARGGIAVQWVPLGEGVVDFKAILAKAKEICPPIAVFNKPITGRPPAIQPVWDAEFMRKYADVRAADFARFLALAKKGGPYERHMVIEDVPGNTAAPLTAALTYQQREHMERGVEYCKKVLDLGVRWRG
jgi:sugar phosphate isomerase/epimerase